MLVIYGLIYVHFVALAYTTLARLPVVFFSVIFVISLQFENRSTVVLEQYHKKVLLV